MKRNLLLLTAAYLACTGTLAGQDVGQMYVPEGATYHAGHYPRQLAPPSRDCDPECQILWGQFRNGGLWENYCAEKQLPRAVPPRHPHETCQPRCAQPDLLSVIVAQRSKVACRRSSCSRAGSTCSTAPAQGTFDCFDLFCDLLGWDECDCCCQSGCDHSVCDAASLEDLAAPQLPDAVPEPPAVDDEPTAVPTPGLDDRDDQPQSDSADEAAA